MSIKDVEIKQATAADIAHFYPNGSPRTCYAWVAYYLGKPACLAGITVERGGCVAFSEILPNAAPKVTIWRAALALLDHIVSLKLPMVAGCEEMDARAQDFVKRLGFKRMNNMQGMEIFTWP